MNSSIVQINLWQFALIYLLLIVVVIIMKKCRISQTKLLIVGSLRMTVQLIIAGLILTYIFKNPHPLFTVLYVLLMIGFAIFRVLSKNKGINKKFKLGIAFSMSISGLSVLVFFVIAVVGENIFNPQYAIPLSGMIMGNTMTGMNLAIKTYRENFDGQKNKIDAMINIGAEPKKILLPFVNKAIETALLPTLNSMVGMGIVSLPGMMTGQILAGTLPTTAILYQISIMIAICTSVCLSVFIALYIGYRTMINSKEQIII